MPFTAEQIQILVEAKVENAVKNFKKIEKTVDNFTSKSNTRFKKFANDTNAWFTGMAQGAGMQAFNMAIGELSKLVGVGVDSVIKEEKAMAKLQSVLTATGGASGKTTEELKKLASSLESTSLFADDAIINAEALLLTFKSIKGDTFDRATKSVLDLSQTFDQDLKTSAIQVGKALEDPIKGLASLTKIGVTFSDEQKKLIETFVATGDIASAQQIILEGLESQTIGTAKALTENLGGGLEKLQMRLGNVSEGVARELLPAFLDIGNELVPMVKNLGTLLTPVLAIVGKIASAIAPALTLVTRLASDVVNRVTLAVFAADEAITDFQIKYAGKYKTMSNVIKTAFEADRKQIDLTVKQYKSLDDALRKKAVDDFAGKINGLTEAIKTQQNVIDNYGTSKYNPLGDVSGQNKAKFEDDKKALVELQNQLAYYIQALGTLKATEKTIEGNVIVPDGNTIGDSIEAVERYGNTFEVTSRWINQANLDAIEFTKTMQILADVLASNLAGAFNDIGRAIMAGEDPLKAFGKAALKTIAGILNAYAQLLAGKGLADLFINTPLGIAEMAAAAGLFTAAGAIEAIPLKTGGDFTVPSGYANDSFFAPLALTSGEEVSVRRPDQKGGGGDTYVIQNISGSIWQTRELQSLAIGAVKKSGRSW